MINDDPIHGAVVDVDKAAVDRIVRGGPGGAFLLAAIATAIVFTLWLTFYLLVFLPRGSV